MAHISKFRPDDIEPESVPVNPDVVLDGDPKHAMKVTWQSDDGTAIAGVFKSTPGKFKVHQVNNEFTEVRKGRVVITAEDGSTVDCGPGDVMMIRAGSTMVYEVLEDLEDHFMITNADGVS